MEFGFDAKRIYSASSCVITAPPIDAITALTLTTF